MNQLWITNYEIYILEKHAEYLENANKHRLEQEALQSGARPARWMEKVLLLFGSWLIASGEKLRMYFVQKRQIPRYHESIKLAR